MTHGNQGKKRTIPRVSGEPVWWAKLAYRGGFHRNTYLPILEGSETVATATDE